MNSVATKLDDCWNRIGVWSQAADKCPELQQHTHCRNCPKYSDAGKSLLDKVVSETLLEENTSLVSTRPDEIEDLDTAGIMFRLNKEWFMLDSGILEEITRPRSIHAIPHNHNKSVYGIANINNDLAVCISLHNILSVSDSISEVETVSRMITVSLDGCMMVIPVDEIKGIYRFNEGKIERTPSTVPDNRKSSVRGVVNIENTDVALLDVDSLKNTIMESIS